MPHLRSPVPRRLPHRAAVATVISIAIGCGQPNQPPPAEGQSSHPEVLFLIHNEVFAIGLDGAGRRSLGSVGDDKHRTGWPRFLPDGRVAVLGDETGTVYPYVSGYFGVSFRRLPEMNVTLHDSLSGATVAGASRLVITATPFPANETTMSRVDIDVPLIEPVQYQQDGVVANPSLYSADRVVAARILLHGESSIEVFDIDGPAYQNGNSEVLARVSSPYCATQPVRLWDGRVAFIRTLPSEVNDTAMGELFTIERDGSTKTTGITGVLGLVVIGEHLVYEVGGADHVSDLVLSDLQNPPINLTNTPYISEHLSWSD